MTESLINDQPETPTSSSVESDLFELEMTDFGSVYAIDPAAGPPCSCACRCLCIPVVEDDP